MKRSLLVAVFSVWMVCGFANDTLTTREIYNFAVGDTFDYQTIDDNPNFSIYTISYRRIVIATKYLSPNNDTLIYNGNITYTDLDSFEVFKYQINDTLCPSAVFQFDSLSGTSITRNKADVGCFEHFTKYEFARGMGQIYLQATSHTEPLFQFFTDRLVYFANGIITWGTPYYVLSSTEIRNSQSAIRISPNPATTSITLQLQQTPATSASFQLFDITGRMVLQKPLTETTNRIELKGVSKGMYLYNVFTAGEKAGAGKLIIE